MASAHAVYKMIAEGDGEFAERNELIMQELPQVQYIASRILERLPQQVELSDLVHAGVIGLLEAYRSFDDSKNAQFKTFAKFRIKGAILDSLRALDWGSRGIRKKAREITEATQKLQGALGRFPTKEEVAAEMKISLASTSSARRFSPPSKANPPTTSSMRLPAPGTTPSRCTARPKNELDSPTRSPSSLNASSSSSRSTIAKN